MTVVGQQVFAASIHANSDAARVDWRVDYDALDYAVVEPPAPVTAGMLAFLKHFGLSFGAFDFVVTPDREWIMLECNPAGAYGWLEQALGLPITSRWPTFSRTEPTNGAHEDRRTESGRAGAGPGQAG